MTVQAALAAVERGDHAAARDALVVAWRARRAPAIAEAVDALDALAPDALTAQLAAIVTPRVATSLANMKKLGAVDDPRLATWVLAALANPPFCAPTAEAFLVLLAKTIGRLRDPRLAAALPQIRPILTARITRKPIYTKVIKLLDAIEVPAIRASELDARLAAAVAPLRKPAITIDALLAEVYAHPDDDAPRMVLADALLQRGDPRGEFITLQLARGRDGEQTERERELLKKHGRSWLGPIATVVSFGKSYSATEFTRGFVSHVDFIFKIEKKLPLVAAAAEWATIETGNLPTIVLEHAQLPALREVTLDSEDFAALERRGTPLPAVVSVAIHRNAPVPSLAQLRRMVPAMTELEIHDIPPWDLAELAKIGLRKLVIELYCAAPELAEQALRHKIFVDNLASTPAFADALTIRAPWTDWRTKPEAVTYARGARTFERVTAASS